MRKKISPALRAITSISIWVLFVVGLAALAMAFVRIVGGAVGITRPPEVAIMTAYFGVGIAGLLSSVVSVLVRKKLE